MAIHVLAPLDRSAYCRAAEALAIRIACAQPSELTALRVVNVRSASGKVLQDLPGRLGFEPAVVDPEVEAEALREARETVERFAREAEAAGVQVTRLVEQGVVEERLAHHGATADLVVMGLRGETEERFPGQGGGHATALLQRLVTPILWAAPGVDRIDAVALGYDGSESACRAARAVRNLLVPLGVPIHVFHVSPDGQGGPVLAEVGEILDGGTVIRHVVQGDPVAEALVQAAVDVGAQVLVLGSSGAHTLREALFGSVAERALASGKLAILTVR